MNINKEFMPSVENTVGTNLANYKIIKKDQFVYNNMQVARDRTIRIVRYADEPSVPTASSWTLTYLSTLHDSMATIAVIIFVVLAMGRGRSSFFEKITLSESHSISDALSAERLKTLSSALTLKTRAA